MTVAVDLVPWDDVHAAALRTAQQAELRERYGDGDDEGSAAGDSGGDGGLSHAMTGDGIVAMVVLRDGDQPVACVALRDVSSQLGPGVGEVKRLYTVPSARGRGYARRVMVELERIAPEQGFTRLVLETGVLQPDAIGLYLTLGYHSVPNYGEYVDEPLSRCFAKDVPASPGAAPRPSRAGTGVGAGTGARAVLETVPWDHDEARALRRAMWAFNVERYPELVPDEPDLGFASDDDRQGVGVLTTWLARVDGAPAGCLSLRAPRRGYPDGSVELKKLFVAESARGAGVARALLAAAHEDVRARGFTTAVLGTGIRQPEAVSLYLSEGYRPVLPFTDHAGDFLTLWFGRPVG